MFEIVCDGALDLNIERTSASNITVVPFYVSPDGGENHKKEGVELSVRNFYEYLVANPTIFPKTSMPSVQDYMNAFEPIAKEGKDIIVITITSKLSGSFNSAMGAKQLMEEQYPDIKIEVVDSTLITGLEGEFAEQAAKMRDAGLSLEETVEKLNEIKATGKIYFTVGNLDYLIHGGRIGKVAGVAAGKLGIKPLIEWLDGELVSAGIARGRKKSLSKCIDNLIGYMKDNNINPSDYIFGLGYGFDIEESMQTKTKLENKLKEEFPGFNEEIDTFQIGATISVHTGPHAFGITLLKKVTL